VSPNIGDSSRQPFFLQGSKGRLFAIYHRPSGGGVRDEAVLLVPPFAEEMNKSRRMLSLQAEAVARTGRGVLLIDLFGSGDSEGEFGEADWSTWRTDVAMGIQWLQVQGVKKLSLLGLRLGALLAADVASNFPQLVSHLVFWSPVLVGRQYVNQFLRLRLAASMMADPREKETTEALRRCLERGESVEVAGYDLAPQLVAEIDTLELGVLCERVSARIDWIDVHPNAGRPLSYASQKVIDACNHQGARVHAQMIVGEPFWSTPEISLVPALISATTEAFAT